MEPRVGFIAYRGSKPPPPPPPPPSHTVSFSERSSIRTNDGDKAMHVGFLSLMDLYRIYKILGLKFFERNIRAGLDPDSPPNKKIREALHGISVTKDERPEVFAFNHNGVTLAAHHVEFGDGKAVLTTPRLLNGAQTITSLHHFLQDAEKKPGMAVDQGELESVRVLAKIVEADPYSEFVTTVAVCNNRQNPVKPWMLRANDNIQCDFAARFREALGIFYERQKGAFESMDEDELDRERYEEKIRPIQIELLAQTFLAVQGEIDKMSCLSDIFEREKDYVNTFRRSFLDADLRKIVIAYKVQLCLRSPMRRLAELAPQYLQYPLSRSRNLVWALLVQGILNAPDLSSDLLERFGKRLAKERDFHEYLRNMASAKLLPLVRTVLSESTYKEYLDKEKYSFLRTKALFMRCMDEAYQRYRWTRRSFYP